MKYDLLMSIQPYYAYLEMKGIKTVEMRKTEPKDKEWSGKVKVYVSQNKKSFNRIPKEDREWFKQYLGKVAFEFICDKVDKIDADWIRQYADIPLILYFRNIEYQEICKNACLGYGEMYKYSNDKDLLALHITDLKIYDEPRELGEFYGYNKELEQRFLDGEDYCCYDATNEYGEAMTECDGENIHNCYRCWEEWSGWRHRITRPPQSWQYVREV